MDSSLQNSEANDGFNSYIVKCLGKLDFNSRNNESMAKIPNKIKTIVQSKMESNLACRMKVFSRRLKIKGENQTVEANYPSRYLYLCSPIKNNHKLMCIVTKCSNVICDSSMRNNDPDCSIFIFSAADDKLRTHKTHAALSNSLDVHCSPDLVTGTCDSYPSDLYDVAMEIARISNEMLPILFENFQDFVEKKMNKVEPLTSTSDISCPSLSIAPTITPFCSSINANNSARSSTRSSKSILNRFSKHFNRLKHTKTRLSSAVSCDELTATRHTISSQNCKRIKKKQRTMDEMACPDKLIGLGEILVDEKASDCFRQFLLQEHSEENLDFYKAVTAWKKQLKDLPFGLKSSAYAIYQDFIADHAQHWVNLDCSVSKQILLQLSSCNTLPTDMKQVSPQNADHTVPKSIFDGALREIYYLMERDSFPRFLDSSFYQQFIHSFASSKRKLLSLSLTNLSR